VSSLLHSSTAIVAGIEQFSREALNHGLFIAATSSRDDPADGEGLAALSAHFNRNLVGRTTNAARTHFNGRSHILKGCMEQLDRILLGFGLDRFESTINDVFSD
jgi:hypothetical protein